MIVLGVNVTKNLVVERPDHYVFSKYPLETQRLDHQGELLNILSKNFIKAAGFTKGMRVLDIGCGTGSFTFLISEEVGPSGHVVGVDKSIPAIERAKQRAHDMGYSNTNFVIADIERESILGEYDAIVGRFILSFLETPEYTLNSICQGQKDLSMLAFQEWQLDSPPPMYPKSDALKNYHELILETLKCAGVEMDMGLRLPDLLGSMTGFELFLLEARQYVGNSRDEYLLAYLDETGTALVDSMLQFGLLESIIEIEDLKSSALEEVKTHKSVISLNPIIGAASRRDIS